MLADNYLAFWFRFVPPNRSALEQGQSACVWESKIVPQHDTYMGPRFGVACRQFIRAEPSRWRQAIPELGVRWSAYDELEIVGHDGGLVVPAGEAKWTKDPIGLAEQQLLEAPPRAGYDRRWYRVIAPVHRRAD